MVDTCRVSRGGNIHYRTSGSGGIRKLTISAGLGAVLLRHGVGEGCLRSLDSNTDRRGLGQKTCEFNLASRRLPQRSSFTVHAQFAGPWFRLSALPFAAPSEPVNPFGLLGYLL